MYWLTKITKHKMVLGILASIVLGLMLLPLAPTPVFADCVPACADGETCTNDVCVSDVGINFGLSYADKTGMGKQDVRVTVSKIINVALGLLGIVAVVIMLVGGLSG